MCFKRTSFTKTHRGGLTLFPCLGPEFVAALMERPVKKAEGSMMRRPRKRYEAFYTLTTALKRVWQKKQRMPVAERQRSGRARE